VGKAPFYDFVFSNSSVCPRQYVAAGARHAHFLPTACAPSVHRSRPPEERYRCDVCFAGDWSALRERMMEALVDRFRVRIFGPWSKKLARGSPLRPVLVDGFFSPDEMAAMFSSAAVVLNLHTWFGEHDHGLNPRLFEAAGCGAYQLVDWKREIPQLFEVTQEVACYRALDEIPAHVERALADPARARAIAEGAQRRAYRDHTYRVRMETLLGIVGRAGA